MMARRQPASSDGGADAMARGAVVVSAGTRRSFAGRDRDLDIEDTRVALTRCSCSEKC
jgi:hypothetical protein